MLRTAVTVALAVAATGPVRAEAPASTLLVANKSDHTLSFVSPESGAARATVPTGKNPHEVAVSPDGKLAVVSDYGNRGEPGSSLTVVDLAGATVARTVGLGGHGRPHGLAWLPDGTVAVTTEGSKHLLVVEPRSGEILRAVSTGQEISHMVVATPDGKRAFVANIGSGTVTAIDLAGGVKTGDIETGAGAEGIALSPDGREVWVGNRAAGTLTVIDAATAKVVGGVDCPGFPIRLAFTPDGKKVLVTCARSGEVAVFDAASREEIARKKLDLTAVEGSEERLFGDAFGKSPVPVGLLVAPDGRRVFVAATQADVVAVLDVETLEVRALLKTGREPDGMAWADIR